LLACICFTNRYVSHNFLGIAGVLLRFVEVVGLPSRVGFLPGGLEWNLNSAAYVDHTFKGLVLQLIQKRKALVVIRDKAQACHLTQTVSKPWTGPSLLWGR
jgi:hypothetical protein